MYYSYYSPAPPTRSSRLPQPKHQIFKVRWLLLLLLVVVAVVFFDGGRPHHARAINKPAPSLSTQLQAITAANPSVQVGIALVNLPDGHLETYGQTSPFVAASTTKLVAATDFLHQVEQGNYSLSGELGAGTAQWQLQELINQSDDDSWQLFIDLLGHTSLNDYAQSIGLTSYDAASNVISPQDEALLLEKLYKGQLLNKADTQLLLSYMQQTNDDSLIPAALPSGATVYHKYGELLDTDDNDAGNFVHDAAIINYQGHSFVLTIYTNRSDMLDITSRQQLIHQITQAVVKAETASD